MPSTDNEPTRFRTSDDITFSLGSVYEFLIAARKEIIFCATAFLIGITVYAYIADKQYQINATISQTDLSDVVPPTIEGGLAMSLLANAANQSQPINDYLIMILSPEIDKLLMDDKRFIPILFNDTYQPDPSKKGVWVHSPSLSFSIKKAFCTIFAIQCPLYLTPTQVSKRLSQHLSISPTVMPDQGVLSPIGSNSSYDIVFIGKDPATSLALLTFLHNATNRAIQRRDITFAMKVEKSLLARIANIGSNDAREQMIMVLSGQEKKLAVLTAATLDYAAKWVVPPSISTWPVKPNLVLLYAVGAVASLIAGGLLHLLMARRFSPNKNLAPHNREPVASR